MKLETKEAIFTELIEEYCIKILHRHISDIELMSDSVNVTILKSVIHSSDEHIINVKYDLIDLFVQENHPNLLNIWRSIAYA